MGGRNERAWLVFDVLLLLLVMAPIGVRLIPAHWSSIWMDHEFQGWMVAVANRLADGVPLYADGMHVPMPPIPYVLEYLVGGGEGVWLTESAMHFGAQALLVLGGYTALRGAFERPVPLCAALAAVPVIFALPKMAIHDTVAQCAAAWTCAAVVYALRTASRRWFVLGACFNAICMLSKQSTAAGLTFGVLLAYLLTGRTMPRRWRLGRALDHAAWTFAFFAVLVLVLSPLVDPRGLLRDVFLTGAEPKGGSGELLRNLGIYARSLAVALSKHGLVALVIVWITRRARLLRARPAQVSDGPAARALLASSVAMTGLWVAALLSPALFVQASDLASKVVTYARAHPVLLVNALLWLGFFLALFGSAWDLVRAREGRQADARAALFVVLAPAAVSHSLSTNVFRWYFDNNPLVVVALGAFVAELFAVSRLLATTRAAARVVAVTIVCAAAVLGTWPTLAGNVEVASRCTRVWPEVRHLRGAKLQPRAEGLRQVVARVRALAHPGESVLLLPDDPNVHAWFERPRPPLAGAIAFIDQYWDRYVELDMARLSRSPPKVIVIGPKGSTAAFYTLFGNRLWGASRLLWRVRSELLPRRYRRVGSFRIGYLADGNFDEVDVFVRRTR
ncbi:MAG: hypothetical protein KC503_02065 [Myxococcales bacterium]|nr:hypothetical protein [Myxococcales bacterium]